MSFNSAYLRNPFNLFNRNFGQYLARPQAKAADLRIHRQEQRYIADNVLPLESLLLSRGKPIEYVPGRPETETTTLYLDTPAGTWSKGHSPLKFRCRSYQDPELWYFELKQRVNGVVDKWRQPVATSALAQMFAGPQRWAMVDRFIGSQPLQPVVAIRYRRVAFEWPNLRVTLDRDVSFYLVAPEAPYALGRRIGGVAGVIVEVKPTGQIPAWLAITLNECRINEFSKSKRALAARGGSAWTFSIS